MNSWLATARDTFKSQLWPLPTIAVVLALALGLGLSELDQSVDAQLSSQVSRWLFGGDADAARSLLGTIASSLVNVTALTFSLTVVTLQLASSQFSPRLLRTFTSDQVVQWTLALFLATFTYALTVLRAVRSASDKLDSEFVPQFAVTVAFVLAIVSVLVLVLFLAHLTEQIRVETMLRTVHHDGTDTMRRVLSEAGESDDLDRSQLPVRPAVGALPLLSGKSGFVLRMDGDALLRLAVEHDAVIEVDAHAGGFLVERTPFGVAWPEAGGRFDDEVAEIIRKKSAGTVETGHERTASHDVGYALRQLTDVANKALSPGINDPTTAVHALGHISALLCDLGDRDLSPERLCDDDGRVRVTLHRPDFATYVDLGISQPRRYGAADAQVMQKVLELLRDLAYRAVPEQVPVVRDQLARTRDTIESQSFDTQERLSFADLGRQVDAALDAVD